MAENENIAVLASRNKPPQRDSRLLVVSGISFDFDAYLFESDPGSQAGKVAVALAQRLISTVPRGGRSGRNCRHRPEWIPMPLRQHAMKRGKKKLFHFAFLAIAPQGVDHVVTFPPTLDHLPRLPPDRLADRNP